MATVYFGADYRPAGWVPTGNWTDVGQWFSDPGSSGEFGDNEGTLLGRLPTQADTVYFTQSILLNFPATWTGPTSNLYLGSPTVNATGTWSGTKDRRTIVYGTSTQPVISGTLPNNWDHQFYGGLVTAAFPSSTGDCIFARDSRYSGPLAISRTNVKLYISDTAIITANIGDMRYLQMTGGTINGTVTVRQMNLSGGTILNSPTISSPTGDNSFNSGPAITITGNTFSMPQTTLIRAQNGNGSLTLKNTTIPATIRCTAGKNLTIDNSSVLGSFALTGGIVYPDRSLTVRGNSTVAQDISTAAIDCYTYNIFNGTFTNPNPWIFGTTSNPVVRVRIGAETYRTVTGYGPYPFLTNKFALGKNIDKLVTDKDITIYGHVDTSVIEINYPTYDLYYTSENLFESQGTLPYDPLNEYGVFTGILKFFPVTGQKRMPYVYINGGKYIPTVTIPATFNGSTYSIDPTNLPYDWGFAENNGLYSATVFVSGLPSTVDTLGSLR